MLRRNQSDTGEKKSSVESLGMKVKPRSVVVSLMGPTACGKTALSLALAARFPFEIINVDSTQVYQGLDIGSGKPDRTAREKTPHHLIDFLDPASVYSAAQFREDALKLISEITQRNRIPLLVGGTMLYFKALQEGLSDLPAADPMIRSQLEKKGKALGWSALHQQLKKIDPITADRLSPTDPQRIQRALEVYEITQKPLSFWLSQPKAPSPYQFINIALLPVTTARESLHQQIAKRFDHMLEVGLIREIEGLLKRGDLQDLPCLRAVGYRQGVDYLLGNLTWEHMRAQGIAATRQLAKRQLTWLRHWPSLIESMDFADPNLVDRVSDFLHSQERVRY